MHWNEEFRSRPCATTAIRASSTSRSTTSTTTQRDLLMHSRLVVDNSKERLGPTGCVIDTLTIRRASESRIQKNRSNSNSGIAKIDDGTKMRISHKHKFVYISITKTGSTTIRHLLNKHSDIISTGSQGDFRHHNTAQQLKDVFTKKDWNWDDYLKFTVVRHPISRIYSMYKYKLRVATPPPQKIRRKMRCHFTRPAKGSKI